MKHIAVNSRQTQLIIQKRAAGESLRKIGADLGIPYSTVQWQMKQHRLGVRVHQNPKGRKPRTTLKTDRNMVLSAKRSRFSRVSDLSAYFNVSPRTFQRRCSAAGLNKRFALIDRLSAHHKVVRAQWCREHRHTNFANWLFSDESSFELAALSIPPHQRVYRSIKEKYKICCIARGGVHIRRSIMVWGAISSRGSACFTILNRNVNSQRYIETIGAELIPYLDNLPLARAASIIFQQDNAPPHRAHRTFDFLAHNGIRTPQWPPLSPDLNPIELVWAAMKRTIATNKPTSIAALRLAIQSSWTRISTPAFCASLYARLPRVIHQVISLKGARD